MKLNLLSVSATAALGFAIATLGSAALADECKVLGPLTKFELATDGKSAQAVVKNNKTGETTMLTITDESTIRRLKHAPIGPGVEIRAHFEKDGKNTCKFFEKAVGGHDRGDENGYFGAHAKK